MPVTRNLCSAHSGYAPPLAGGGIKRWCCLTSVAYVGPKSRTERPRKTKIGTEATHVTRDSDTTFKVKRSKVKVTRPLWSQRCWRVRRLQQWAWERVGRGKPAMLPSARRHKALRRPRGRRGAGAYRGGRLPTACLFWSSITCQVTGYRDSFDNESKLSPQRPGWRQWRPYFVFLSVIMCLSSLPALG